MKYAIEVIGKLNAEVEKLKAENARLKAEVERLNTIIVSGGAVVPDATPYKETDER